MRRFGGERRVLLLLGATALAALALYCAPLTGS